MNMVGTHPSIQKLDRVTSLPDRYKGMLVDFYGCLFDGKQPYSSSIHAVKALAEQGRRMLVLSNSSRRSAATLDKVAGLGFPRGAFAAGAVTSGEVVHQGLLTRPDAFWRGLGCRVYHLTWGERGGVSLDSLDLQVVATPEEADMVLCHGCEGEATPSGGLHELGHEELKERLRRAAARGLPLLVANPDLVTVDEGDLRIMPGTLAQWYEGFGGRATLLGKPAAAIYDAALKQLGLAPAEVICVGDSLHHDIGGAAAAGLDSLLIGCGIHDLGAPSPSQRLDVSTERVEALLRGLPGQAWPQYYMDYLQD